MFLAGFKIKGKNVSDILGKFLSLSLSLELLTQLIFEVIATMSTSLTLYCVHFSKIISLTVLFFRHYKYTFIIITQLDFYWHSELYLHADWLVRVKSINTETYEDIHRSG